MVAFGLVAALAVALGTAHPHASVASDPPRIVAWHLVGNIFLGMSRSRLERAYGEPIKPGATPNGLYVYRGGGNIGVWYQHGYVVGIQTSSSYYRTRTGFGVGSTIPLGRCHRTPRGCVHLWNGFRYDTRNVARPKHHGEWQKVVREGKRIRFVQIRVARGIVTSFYVALA